MIKFSDISIVATTKDQSLTGTQQTCMLIKFNSSSDLNETLEHLFSEGPGPN